MNYVRDDPLGCGKLATAIDIFRMTKISENNFSQIKIEIVFPLK